MKISKAVSDKECLNRRIMAITWHFSGLSFKI